MILTSIVYTQQDAIPLFVFGMLEIPKTLTYSPWNITQIGSTTFSYVAAAKISFQQVQIPQSKFGMLTRVSVCQRCELTKIMSKLWRMPKTANRCGDAQKLDIDLGTEHHNVTNFQMNFRWLQRDWTRPYFYGT